MAWPVAAPGFTIWGGAQSERRRREDRGAEGAETETPKALRGERMGMWFPLPSRLGGLGERRKLPSGIRGGAPAENDSSAF